MTQTISFPQYDNAIYQIMAMEYNVCIPNDQSGSNMYTNLYTSEGTFYYTYSTWDDSNDCAGSSTSSQVYSYPAVTEGAVSFSDCDYQPPAQIAWGILTHASDWQSNINQIPIAKVSAAYITPNECLSLATPYTYTAISGTTCGQQWGQCGFSELALSFSSGETITYESTNCQTSTTTSQNIYNTQCTLQPNYCTLNDCQNAYVYDYYSGSSSSNSDSSTLNVSNASFGTLIAFIFIAFGVGAVIGICYVSSVMQKKPLASQQNRETEVSNI